MDFLDWVEFCLKMFSHTQIWQQGAYKEINNGWWFEFLRFHIETHRQTKLSVWASSLSFLRACQFFINGIKGNVWTKHSIEEFFLWVENEIGQSINTLITRCNINSGCLRSFCTINVTAIICWIVRSCFTN